MANQSGDIALDDNFDLRIENGDFVIEESDFRHIQMILQSDKGWWHQTPYLGAGLPSQIEGFFDSRYLQKARLNLEADGFNVRRIFEQNGILQVEAEK